MIPPHLPPPSCSIEQHHRWQRLKIILIASFFGILAGITGAAVFFGWLWPSVAEGDTWAVTRQGGRYSRDQLVAFAESNVQDKMFSIYRRRAFVNAVNYLDSDEKIGDAILAVSDGWLVAYLPAFDGSYKDWSILSAEGDVYTAVKALSDPRTGLLYIKITSNGNAHALLSAANFSSDIRAHDTVFVRFNGQWVPATVDGEVYNPESTSHLDGVANRRHILSGEFKQGSLAIDEQGNLVGFVDESGFLKPVFNLGDALSGIDQKTKITHASLGAEGWFSDEQPLIVGNKAIEGFFVNKVLVAKSLLKKGDIIIQVQGRGVTHDRLWDALARKEVTVKVLRGNQEMEIALPVVEL